MQTFLVHEDPKVTAKILDYKRLGKQRVECCQILKCLLGESNNSRSWHNHPATKMWKGYESFLCRIYLRDMILEWFDRGYKGPKCQEHYKRFLEHSLVQKEPIVPDWFSEDLFTSHKSNLLRKDKEYYSQHFKGIPDNLEYIWPV